MNILITAGPTREYIDDIRFITNRSSGAMGLALSEEAVKREHNVTVVLGPTNLTPIYGIKVIPVTSSNEMTDRTLAELAHGFDVLVCTAAIGDFTPIKKVSGKIKSGSELTVKLKPTRKLIQEARQKYPKLRIVAFKVEYDKAKEELVDAGRGLLDWADIVVANDVSGDVFGSHETEAYIITEGVEHIPRMSKGEAAKRIFDVLESRLLLSADGR